MTRIFEYKIEDISVGTDIPPNKRDDAFMSKLNKEGEMGWEVVDVQHYPTSKWLDTRKYTFKRELI